MLDKTFVVTVLKFTAEGAVVEVLRLEFLGVVLVNNGTKTISTVRCLMFDNIVVRVEQSYVSARFGVGDWRTEE